MLPDDPFGEITREFVLLILIGICFLDASRFRSFLDESESFCQGTSGNEGAAASVEIKTASNIIP